MTPGQFGPMSARLGRRDSSTRLHLDHVERRDALGDADDHLDAGVGRLEDRVGRARRRHEDDRRVGAGLLHRLLRRCRTPGMPSCTVPPLPGVTPPTTLVPYSRICLAWNVAGAAGDALNDELRLFSDEDRHGYFASPARDSATIFCAPSAMSSAVMTVQPRLRQHLLAELDVGAFEPHDQRHLEPDLLDRRDHAGGDGVALHDAAEDVDEDPLHVGVAR